MTRPEPVRAAEASRRREVERALAEAGLLSGPRSVAPMAAEESFARRLRTALERLGPVFSAFGLYLASRADLLPAGDCLELSALPDRGEPIPADAILGLTAAELRRPPQEVFASFDERPRESRLLFQAHTARLLGGEAVLVRVVRPSVEGWLQGDLPLLPLLGAAFAEAGGPAFPLEEALADFRATLPRSLDLAAQAEALDVLATETDGYGPLHVLQVHLELTTPKMLVLQDLAEAAAGRDPGLLARRLCLIWLRQALLGRTVPVEPWGANVTFLPGERIALQGGLFAKLPSPTQRNLRDYLIAASNQDPEAVCTSLLREMMLEGPASAEERFRLRLRQAVPFRDGGWSASGETLAEHLFLHWRFARDCGFRPRPHLLAFFRGLTAVAAAARRLEPNRDALLEAFEEVRLLASVQQLGELMTVEQMRETFERYAALMVELPRKLDQVLTITAEARQYSSSKETRESRNRKNLSVVLVVSWLALVTIALLINPLASVNNGRPWFGVLGLIVFITLGVLFVIIIHKEIN